MGGEEDYMIVYVKSTEHNTWQKLNIQLTSAFIIKRTQWTEQEATRIPRNHWEFCRIDFELPFCRYLGGVVIKVLRGL